MLNNVPITQEDLAESGNIFNQVDNVIALSISTGDPLLACEFGAKLEQVARVTSVALAKLLFKLYDSWDIISASGVEDDYYNFVEAHMGYRPSTVRKYINMWEGIFEYSDLSEEVKDALAGKSMRELLKLTGAIREGSLTDDDIQAAIISDEQGIREIVRRARGEQTSSNSSIYITIEPRKEGGRHPLGTMVAYQQGEREVIGYLNLRAETDFGRRAVERILSSSAGITES